MSNLWFTEDIVIEDDTDKVLKKAKKKAAPVSVEKAIKSKSVSIKDKLELIKSNVYKKLGRYADDVECIRDIVTFSEYIDKAIENGIISIDTETNNSLDPLTCKIMGLCLYTLNKKAVYIPVNHTDLEGNLIDGQITELQIKEQLDRLTDKGTKIIAHNWKFDYKVIYCTCDCSLSCYWDTYVGARILNENEPAGLKFQYRDKIDSDQEKYDIEELFNLEYRFVDPDIFALYAATDSLITYKLYLWQKNVFESEDNSKIFSLFKDVEMQVLPVLINMELTGVCIDADYAVRLHNKYQNKLDIIEQDINSELLALKPLIDKWRKTKEANVIPIDGKKSKAQQLSDPPEVGSTLQLAILLYDILNLPIVDKKNPRGTGVEILTELAKTNKLCEILLDQRSVSKLMTAFIDILPGMVSPRDNRLHANFNQLGTDTGRQSCTQPNLQQIPSRNSDIRLLFRAKEEIINLEFDDFFDVFKLYELEMSDGSYKQASKICVGDILNDNIVIKNIKNIDNKTIRFFCMGVAQ